MAASASSIQETGGLEVGNQFTDLWGHVYAPLTNFAQDPRFPASVSACGPAVQAQITLL